MGVFKNLTDPIIHFSKCTGTLILNENGKRLGKFVDFFIDYEEVYPTVIAILFKSRNEFYFTNWLTIKNFSYEEIILSNNARIRKGHTFPKIPKLKSGNNLLKLNYNQNLESKIVDYPPLGEVVLNQQVVDTHGKKVVKVTDIHFIKIGRLLRVTHADTAPEKNFFAKLISNKNDENARIPWKYVHKIGSVRTDQGIELNVSTEELEAMHPADLADILEDLDEFGRSKVFAKLDTETAADTIAEIEDGMKSEFIKSKSKEEVALILDELGTDEAADLISELPKNQADEILANISDTKMASDIKGLLAFPADSAGGIMSTEFLALKSTITKSEVIKHLQMHHEEYENFYDVFLVDNETKLQGVIPMKELIISLEDIELKDLIGDSNLIFGNPNMPWREVSKLMSKYNLINLPICDEEMKLLGFVSIDDILPWHLKED